MNDISKKSDRMSQNIPWRPWVDVNPSRLGGEVLKFWAGEGGGGVWGSVSCLAAAPKTAEWSLVAAAAAAAAWAAQPGPGGGAGPSGGWRKCKGRPAKATGSLVAACVVLLPRPLLPYGNVLPSSSERTQLHCLDIVTSGLVFGRYVQTNVPRIF